MIYFDVPIISIFNLFLNCWYYSLYTLNWVAYIRGVGSKNLVESWGHS